MNGERLRPLDGIRALAVAGTVAFHLPGSPLEGGIAGVDMFFVLSGFLIGGILLDQAQSGRLHLLQFWAARARRLFPAVIVVLLVVYAALMVAASASDRVQWARESMWAALYGQNFHFIAVAGDYFAPDLPSPVEHLWSLSVEEQFYVLFPLVVLAAMALAAVTRRKGNADGAMAGLSGVRAWLLVLALGVVSASGAFNLVVSAQGYTPWAYYDLRARAVALAAGVALACVLTRGVKARLGRAPEAVAAAVSIAALAAIAGVMVWVSSPEGYLQLGIPVTVAATLVLVVVAHCPSTVTRALKWGPLVGLGLISYGVYLWSVPVSSLWGETAAREGVFLPWVWTVCVTVTLTVAFASWKFVEMPVRQSVFLVARPGVSLLSGVVALALVAGLFALPARAWTASAEPGQAAVPGPSPAAVGVLVSCDSQAQDLDIKRDDQDLGCVLYDPGASREATVLLVGNSVMQTLYPGLLEQARDRKWRLLASAMPGCPLGYLPPEGNPYWPARETGDVPGSDGCQAMVDSASALVDSGQVDLVAALDMTRSGIVLDSPDGIAYWPTVKARYKEVLAGWARDARLLLVLDFPALDAPGTPDLRSPPRLERQSRGESNGGAFIEDSRAMLLEALPEGAAHLDLNPLVCPQGWPCPWMVEGVQLRTDQIHFTHQGSFVVARVLAEKIQETLEKPAAG